MQIQINAAAVVDGREAFADDVRDVVENALARFGERITRVEVHLSDQNGKKSGEIDKRCVMEARLEGRQPTAVVHAAATLKRAVAGAAHKLARSIERVLDRANDHR